MTATELLKQRLLAEIKDRLVYSNKTVSEISFDLNYAEPGHMMRFFKMQTGMTTSAYLESLSTM
ncbi:helix-turn-helix domain-containing protein [Chryseobacterium sp. 3008163]|uniref:helix-turn-helix domain-containing protein n=1 Tax=Chryseobacterium sp. 3008163 TaxID=2478663 RepID=UPI00397766C6